MKKINSFNFIYDVVTSNIMFVLFPVREYMFSAIFENHFHD